LGRPRNGTIAFNCLEVKGCASGSALAAAVIALSSFEEGIRMTGTLDVFDIVFDLSANSSAQADNPSHGTSVQKRHVVESTGVRSERDHTQLVIVEPIINPN